ncbi:MAG: hypothetical protein ABEK16_04085 [Candidatus Nanohalobium sp.]
MVETSLELECRGCGNNFWYSGQKQNPETVECPGCHGNVRIPEEG